MKTAIDVAKYFLAQMSEECGDTISNLKLQKLCYYAQGFHLAVTGKSLFAEDVQAWEHGPVVPSVYHEYKHFGSGGIDKPENFKLSKFSDDEREILDEVYKIFGQFSAWKLRNMTHEEPPWKESPLNGTIPKAAMERYFKTMILDD